MAHQFIVSFIGDDRTGIVGQLSEAVARHGGNWLESSLSQLGGKFAGLVLIELDVDQAAALEAYLAALPGGRESVRVTAAGTKGQGGEANLSLALIGPDRPGIVREVSAALASAGINVTQLETAVESAAFTGEPIFRASISAHAPAEALDSELELKIEAIADAMTLDIDLNRR